MSRDAHNDSDGRVIRGAIVILLAGIVIGLAFNTLLRASNGDHGLAWFRQEVKLNHLEEVLADSSAVTGGDSVTVGLAPEASNESPRGDVARDEISSLPETPDELAPDERAELPPPPEPETVAGGRAVTVESPPPAAIPDSDEPLLAQHGTVKVLHAGGGAVFVDARSAEEFAAGHIPGAVNLPFDLVYEDPTLLDRLDAGDKPIVCYCDGSECELAENLAFVLIDAGYRKVLVYEGGTLAWTAASEILTTGDGN
jgi:rhodanese-related sulfurtransferase